ncbi:hypothetical protein EJ110_NYTH13651, partial [Nymphaea thermarum]
LCLDYVQLEASKPQNRKRSKPKNKKPHLSNDKQDMHKILGKPFWGGFRVTHDRLDCLNHESNILFYSYDHLILIKRPKNNLKRKGRKLLVMKTETHELRKKFFRQSIKDLKALHPPCPTCHNTHGEQSMVAKFPQRLSPEYTVAKVQMLTRAEISNPVEAYNRLSRHVVTLSQSSIDALVPALVASRGRGGSFFRRRGTGRMSGRGHRRFQYTNCGEIEHLEDRCWDKHGRPSTKPEHRARARARADN